MALHTLHHVNVIAMRATLALRDGIRASIVLRALNRHCRDTAQQKHIVLAQNPASSPDDATSANAALAQRSNSGPSQSGNQRQLPPPGDNAVPCTLTGKATYTHKITPHSRAPKISRPNAQQAPARRPPIRHFLCFDTTRNTNGAIMPSAIAPPHIAATPVYPRDRSQGSGRDPPAQAREAHHGKGKKTKKNNNNYYYIAAPLSAKGPYLQQSHARVGVKIPVAIDRAILTPTSGPKPASTA